MKKTSESTFPLQEKIAALEAIEKEFQKPEINLAKAIEQQEQAVRLAKEIEDYLKRAESTLTKLTIS